MSDDFKDGCEHARDLILSRITIIREGLLKEDAKVAARILDILYNDLAKRYGDVFDDFKMTV